MEQAIYAIGDVHGHRAQLERRLEWIEQDGGSSARLVMLGDYVDRGPDSKGVLELLIDLSGSRDIVCLKGNHDRMFEWFLEAQPRPDPYLMVSMSWLHERLGGVETLASYGVAARGDRRLKDVHADALAAVPDAHRVFLQNLELSHETATLFFAHAGIRPGVPLCDQDEEDLLWIRQDFLIASEPHPKLIIHGHTPVNEASHFGNHVNMDSGAAYGNPLSAAVFEGGEAFLLTESGRVPLPRGIA